MENIRLKLNTIDTVEFERKQRNLETIVRETDSRTSLL